MTRRARSLAGNLIRLGGAAVLIAALVGRVRGGASKTEPAEDRQASAEASASPYPELVTYVVGYLLALALTIAAFAPVYFHWTPPSTALEIVLALAFVQIIVHFRCFLHVTPHGPARDDLLLIVFSTLIILLMVGGTLVVLFNLRTRMM